MIWIHSTILWKNTLETATSSDGLCTAKFKARKMCFVILCFDYLCKYQLTFLLSFPLPPPPPPPNQPHLPLFHCVVLALACSDFQCCFCLTRPWIRLIFQCCFCLTRPWIRLIFQCCFCLTRPWIRLIFQCCFCLTRSWTLAPFPPHQTLDQTDLSEPSHWASNQLAVYCSGLLPCPMSR